MSSLQIDQSNKFDYEFIITSVIMSVISILALICLIGEIWLLVKFGNDDCLNKEVRLTSLLQVFICNIICYIFILTGSCSFLFKFIIEKFRQIECKFEKNYIFLFVIPTFGFLLSGPLSITEVYVFAFMAGKGVCTDPTLIEFLATTVSIKLFILMICIGLYFSAYQNDFSNRNSLSNQENNMV